MTTLRATRPRSRTFSLGRLAAALVTALVVTQAGPRAGDARAAAPEPAPTSGAADPSDCQAVCANAARCVLWTPDGNGDPDEANLAEAAERATHCADACRQILAQAVPRWVATLGLASRAACPAVPPGVRNVPLRALSPDGRHLVFVGAYGTEIDLPPVRSCQESDVFLSRPDGRDARPLTKSRRGADPAWSPDGTRLALADADSIYVMAADGSGRRRIVAGRTPQEPQGEYDYVAFNDPRWSPNGAFLAVSPSSGAIAVDAIYDLGPAPVERFRAEVENCDTRWTPASDHVPHPGAFEPGGFEVACHESGMPTAYRRMPLRWLEASLALPRGLTMIGAERPAPDGTQTLFIAYPPGYDGALSASGDVFLAAIPPASANLAPANQAVATPWKLKALTTGHLATDAAWSSDGRIAIATKRALIVTDRTGKQTTIAKATPPTQDERYNEATFARLAWSPDNARLVWDQAPPATVGIHVWDAASGRDVEVQAGVGSATWTPEGGLTLAGATMAGVTRAVLDALVAAPR